MWSKCSWLGRVALAVLVVIGVPQFARADFIDLVSQSYHIQGSGTGITAYNITSAIPITRTDVGDHFNPDTGNHDGQVVITTRTDAGITPTSAFVQAGIDSVDAGNAFAGPTAASAAITFRPLVSGVVVKTSGSGGGNPNPFDILHGTAQLFDETMGATLFTQGVPTPMTYNYTLDLSHLYTLSVFTSLSSGGVISWNAGANIAPAPVPESESTLTFLAVGLGALLIIARSQMVRPAN
jgi:hypothetical protein